MFAVTWDKAAKSTAIPDCFITEYMPAADGEHVKVFLALVMLYENRDDEISAAKLARLSGTGEADVAAAIKYWESRGVLESYIKDGELSGIKITLDPSASYRRPRRLSRSRVKELEEDKQARMLLALAEKYFERPLSASEISTLLYFLDELDFPFELCDYLVDYCVSKGHKSMRYIEKVALSWHEKGYKTADEAREASKSWSKIHFDVLKAFGIAGRNPIRSEIEYIDKWNRKFGFSMDIISEACSMTLAQTGKQSFAYADSILTRWHEAGVKSLGEAKCLGEEFRKTKGSGKPAQNRNNKFLNYNQRDDDLGELERRLDRQFAQIMGEKDGTD